jgi:hypothetical protein
MERTCRFIAIVLVMLFFAAVARFYHRGTGFTALIGFPPAADSEPPALSAIPHYQYPASASYDGQFYAERALDPLVRDPTVDRGMDLAPFRARRILFCWTAYVLGLGRPAWILEAYALQNVLCWAIIAVLLTKWLSPSTPRGLALWTACLFSHGLLWSVRFALLDGPSLMLTMWAVAAAEQDRPLRSGVIVGINALGRETNLLVALAQPIPRTRADWVRAAAALVLAGLPSLIWMDYLRSIYRSTTLAGTDTFVFIGSGLAQNWRALLGTVISTRRVGDAIVPACILLSVVTQAAFIFVRRDYLAPWWRVACAYGVMLLFLDPVLVAPSTAAITRVMLPLTTGFNILLAQEERPARFWPWFVAGNLDLVTVLRVMPLIPWQ